MCYHIYMQKSVDYNSSLYKSKANKIINDFIDNPQNIKLIDSVEKDFIDTKLYTELIELYRLEFFYTMNPICFEKIGDILYKQKKYEEALDSYLSCAEISENYSPIFKKLGKVFGKINDNDSRLACIEQAKLIERENG